MKTYKTPGVYVEEISTLPPSVAEVSTAIPAFLGYTEKGPPIGSVSSMVEFAAMFGGAKPTAFTVATANDPATGLPAVSSVASTPANAQAPDRLLYYALSHYFANGGGPCYVLSLGADEYFTKPFSPLALLRTVEKVLAPGTAEGSG